jgi:hypothetical protein
MTNIKKISAQHPKHVGVATQTIERNQTFPNKQEKWLDDELGD